MRGLDMAVRIKRAYEPADPSDGVRVLVDRYWPRGLAREQAHIDNWLRNVAPSDSLRRWFGHDPVKWPEFRRRYLEELARGSAALTQLRRLAQSGDLTLVYAARDQEHNNAVVLVEWLSLKGETGRSPSP